MSDQICTRCLTATVNPVNPAEKCWPSGWNHHWVTAVITDCPFLVRTPTGRVTPARVEAATEACELAGDAVHSTHHYGDREGRHWDLPKFWRRSETRVETVE